MKGFAIAVVLVFALGATADKAAQDGGGKASTLKRSNSANIGLVDAI